MLVTLSLDVSAAAASSQYSGLSLDATTDAIASVLTVTFADPTAAAQAFAGFAAAWQAAPRGGNGTLPALVLRAVLRPAGSGSGGGSSATSASSAARTGAIAGACAAAALLIAGVCVCRRGRSPSSKAPFSGVAGPMGEGQQQEQQPGVGADGLGDGGVSIQNNPLNSGQNATTMEGNIELLEEQVKTLEKSSRKVVEELFDTQDARRKLEERKTYLKGITGDGEPAPATKRSACCCVAGIMQEKKDNAKKELTEIDTNLTDNKTKFEKVNVRLRIMQQKLAYARALREQTITIQDIAKSSVMSADQIRAMQAILKAEMDKETEKAQAERELVDIVEEYKNKDLEAALKLERDRQAKYDEDMRKIVQKEVSGGGGGNGATGS